MLAPKQDLLFFRNQKGCLRTEKRLTFSLCNSTQFNAHLLKRNPEQCSMSLISPAMHPTIQGTLFTLPCLLTPFQTSERASIYNVLFGSHYNSGDGEGHNYYFYSTGNESAKQNILSSHSKSVAKLSLEFGIYFFEKYSLKLMIKSPLYLV